MASSSTDLCNSALIKVGANRITALDTSSKEAVICNEQYPNLRQDLLASHPWNFNTARATLAADATAPTWGYNYRYPLPADSLRVLDVDTDLPWKVEGRFLLTDETTVNILYSKDETDVSKWSAYFCEAFAYRMASDLAMSISQNASLQTSLYAQYEKQLAKARSFDAQEGSIEQVEADLFLDARF